MTLASLRVQISYMGIYGEKMIVGGLLMLDKNNALPQLPYLMYEMIREIFSKIRIGEAIRKNEKRTQKITFEY